MIQRVRCIILGPTGHILLGRNRSHRFNLPGGKLHQNEHPVDGLYREIEEETGFTKLKGLKYLWEHKNNKIFIAQQEKDTRPTNVNDPDQEFNSFGWFSTTKLPVRLDRYAKSILETYINKKATAGTIEVLVDGKKVYDLDDDMVWETMPRVVQKQVNEGKDIKFRQVLDDGSVVDVTPKVFPDYMLSKKGKAESDKLPGGLADDKTPKDFDPHLLEQGTLIELEHTKDKELAKEIAMDHLTEDSEYYIKLRKIEGGKATGDGNTERSLQMKRIYETIDELLLRYIPEEKTRPSAEIVYKVNYMGKTTWRPMAGENDYTHITVNHKIVDNPDILRQVLAHEIIHHHLYQTYGKDVAKHGEHFEMIADKINAKEGKNFVTEFANHTKFKKNV